MVAPPLTDFDRAMGVVEIVLVPVPACPPMPLRGPGNRVRRQRNPVPPRLPARVPRAVPEERGESHGRTFIIKLCESLDLVVGALFLGAFIGAAVGIGVGFYCGAIPGALIGGAVGFIAGAIIGIFAAALLFAFCHRS